MDLEELNILNSDEKFSYEEYFSIMEISEEEKKRRIKLAEDLEEFMLTAFLLFSQEKEDECKNLIYEKYIEVSLKFLGMKDMPAYIESYAKELSDEITRVTREHDGEEFYTSKNRVMLISANEANMLGNYDMHIQAIKEGKQYKTWVTEKDEKVRHTHREVDEKKISIFGLFRVGDSIMAYPKDHSYGAELKEIAGCRCVVKYS